MSTRPLLLAVALLASSGCISKHRRATRLEGRYEVGDPGAAWARVTPGSADKAWYSADLAATIYTDSNCGSRFDDRELSALADSVAFGMITGDPLSEQELMVDDRAALLRTVDGRLDGVGFRLGVAVLKKDACVYDLLLVAPRSSFDQAWPHFEAVLAGFTTRGG